jgi:putative nucleotidyltransferase with HDIG domain
MQLHEQTVHRLEQLNALRAVDQAISSSRDMHLTFNILLTHTISQLNVDATDVLLFYPGSNTLELVASQGFHTLLVESASLSDSFAGRAIVEHRSIVMLDFETAKQNPQFGKLWKEEGFVCYWCVPLIVKGEVKGVLEVYRRNAFTPDAEWIEFLEALAGQAAIAIDNTQLFENLQRANMDLGLAYDATIEGWSRAMDMRDHETEGHTLRVTDLTLKLARAMRVSESQLIAIRRGALLHDIGKMGVPDAILLKDGKLTDEEWAIMREHPQLARDMLLPIAYLNDAINIPYCHHEKWDGTGYPQGLKGDHIPIAARVFAVVDVWDALTNDRTYRKKWSKQKALQYIREQSGRHFDPQVVDIFLNNIGKIS